MNDQKINPLPKPDKKDIGMTAVRAIISSVPTIGGAALEIFNSVIASPVQQRRDQWLEHLADVVNQLVRDVESVSFESLKNNDEFISIVMEASTIAIKNHQAEKLNALKNAIKHTITQNQIDFDTKKKFLSLIDLLTITHVKLLVFFLEPKSHFSSEEYTQLTSSMGGSIKGVISKAFLDFNQSQDIYISFIHDLENYGLISEIPLNAMMTGGGTISPRITPLGRLFLEFIRE